MVIEAGAAPERHGLHLRCQPALGDDFHQLRGSRDAGSVERI